jgi:hypothetical protein
MNVLFTGPYRQSDNWGKVSREFLKLLYSQKDLNVISRPVYYNVNGSLKDIGELEECEYKKLEEEKDILIQFGLPITFVSNSSFKKNIGITMLDSKVKNIGWSKYINLLDEIIVFSEQEKTLLEDSGVDIKITVLDFMPFSFDNNISENIKIESTGKFMFYTDAKASDSSGIEQTLTSFLSTFTSIDNVGLLIFTNKQEHEYIENAVKTTKAKLGIFEDERNYPSLNIVPDKSQEILNYAHNTLDCYISIANNSTLNTQVMQAFMFVTPSIILDTCGNIFDGDYPLFAKSQETICATNNRTYPNMNCGIDTWREASELSLSKLMRDVYNDNNVVKLSKEIIESFNLNFKTKISSGVKKAICL